MSEPTVQDLVESVDALGKTTSVLVERYTEAIFGVEASAGSAAEDAKKTAADRVQTGLDTEFTALKANEAKDSAAQAEQAKLDAQELTQLSTFKQYRDQAQQGATTSTAQAVIATQKGTLATEKAAIATNKANVATAEATKSTTQAGIATQKAQSASDSERVVLQKAQEVSDNTTLVATHTATVVRKSDEVVVNAATVVSQTNTVNQKAAEVASNASTVASNTTTTTQKAAEATNAANTSNNNARLSKEWAVGFTPPSGKIAPSNTNNAMYWAQQAQYNASQTFISGGLFTPSVSAPYPSIEGVVRDTIWIIEFPSEDTTFTYTSGQLSGRMVKNGDLLFWDTPENKFHLIPTKIGGILSLVTEWGTETGPSVDIRGRYVRKNGDIITGGLGIDHGSATTPGLRVGALTHKAAIGVSSVVGEVLYGAALQGTDITAYLRIGHALDSLKFSPDTITQYEIFHKGNPPRAADVTDALSSKDQAIWKDRGSRPNFNDSDSLRPGFFSFSPGAIDAPASGIFGHGFTVGKGYNPGNGVWATQVVFGHNGLTYYRNAVNTKPQGEWQRFYTTRDKPTASDVGAVAGTTKAAFIAAGTTGNRPNSVEFPPNTRALRFNTTTGEWEGLDSSGNITPIGGGGVPPFIEKTASFTVEKKKAYKLRMVDGVNKVVTVPDGFANDDWFVISTLDWDRGLAGLTATVQFGTEVLTNGQEDFDGYIIDRPCVLYFLKSGGKWTLADGIGIDGSYNALEKRVEELESWPKVGSNGNGDWVMYEDGRMECSLTRDLGSLPFIQVGGVSRCSSDTWIFPRPFVSKPQVMVSSGLAANDFQWGAHSEPTPTQVIYVMLATSVSSSVRTIAELRAWGRWK